MADAVLKAELTNDPLARGYVGMTDVQAADSLNAKNRQVDPTVVPTMLILTAMVLSEYATLTADQKQYLGYLFSREAIDIRNGTQPRVALLAMFPAGSTTRANIVGLLVNQVSRGEELGIGFVRAGDIAMARAA